jgi:acyl-coenzyme A synthetase/AMP-(fatty) acid ligase
LPAAQLLLGIAYAGMVAVPLNVQAGESELISRLSHCSAKVLFLGQRFLGRISDAQLADLAVTVCPVDHAFLLGADYEHVGVARLPIIDTGDHRSSFIPPAPLRKRKGSWFPTATSCGAPRTLQTRTA